MASSPTRVCVIGAGYVGLVTAACLAELGHDVRALDHDRDQVAALREGIVRIHEPGLAELVRRHTEDGHLRFTTEPGLALAGARVVVIAVGTPSSADGRADTSAVFAAARAALAEAPNAVICIKSTVPPGTTEAVECLGRSLGIEIPAVISNPEFLREGQAVRDFMLPDRIVVGTTARAAGDLVAGLYARLNAPVVRCTPPEAELAKYASNALLASRVSFMNEVSELADAVGADITAVSGIVGMDRRIGSSFLKSGLGWGGSCFPKDVTGLAALARDLGCSSAMLDAAVEVNVRQRTRALDILLAAVAGQPDPVIGVLGLAFKPGTNDVRESPALVLARILIERGIHVRATDPLAIEGAARALNGPQYVIDAYEAAVGADALVLATEWPAYSALDWSTVRLLMRGATVLDARNVLDPRSIEAHGLVYRSLGRDSLRAGKGRDPVYVV